MFDNVIIGVDGRSGGHDAVALAHRLAAPTARVTLAHIYGCEEGLPGSGSMLLRDQLEGGRELLVVERERGWPTAETVCAYATSVGKGLHQIAEQRGADLLMVGSSHHGVAGKVLMGDDTRAALNGAPCAIAIAPHGYELTDTHLQTIGVGYDGRPESRVALEFARGLAQSTGAAITAVWVVTHEDVRCQAPLPADWPAQTEMLVASAQGELDGIGGVTGHAVYGGPREELTKLARATDLLIVGSRGYGPLGSLFHGSVSSYLERHAQSGLLVVPRRRHVAETADSSADVGAVPSRA